MIEPVLPSRRAWTLHDTAASRRIEQAALQHSEAHALMAAAGLAVARLTLAVAPHQQPVWVAAGPGNNGGDGLVAARHLHAAGRQVRVSLVGHAAKLPADAQHALQQAQLAGVPIETGVPAGLDARFAIDALLGIGASRAPQGELAAAIERLNDGAAPVLAVDLPSGLDADRGQVLGAHAVRAAHTLSLLTLKPGLFTARGRDHCGRIWLDDLGADAGSSPMQLAGPPQWPARQHAHHKGSFGDVIVIGGAPGMGGAALLAARAALTAGAGRVYLVRLDPAGSAVDADRPELMSRSLVAALDPSAMGGATVVCGCGGGQAVQNHLAPVLHHAARLVLDADALNAVAAEPGLARALAGRRARGLHTVLTPHPLEAARLLNCTAAQVQADRLGCARRLAAQGQCTVVLKGSGSVVASSEDQLAINPTGNARLATAGSGDVLAGWTGGLWSQQAQDAGFQAAQGTVWLHGHAAESEHCPLPLRASDLIEAMARSAERLA